MNAKTINKRSSDCLRLDFPLLARQMNHKPLVYLDNAATTQKPLTVIERLSEFYKKEYATIHRGVYALSQDSTIECEEVRESLRHFINAKRSEEIIFVRGATEAINLVASSYVDLFLNAGDEIIVSEIEHHANFVPWQVLAKRKGLKLQLTPVNDKGELLMDSFKALLSTKTKFVALTHVSNVLGTHMPIQEVIQLAHGVGAKVLIDGAQAIPHTKVDVQALDCDFYCFSGHKMYGPTGIGVLYGKFETLNQMRPYQYGGDMIEKVDVNETTFAPVPAKFEAGTPAIAEIVGLGEAIRYLQAIGLDNIESIETELLLYATAQMRSVPQLRIIGDSEHKTSVISFVLEGAHPHDIGTILDQEGIAIRAGHHCSQTTMHRFNVPATARASFSFYNTKADVDALIQGVQKVIGMLR